MISTETAEQGVTERRFDLEVDTGVVPGILWEPSDALAAGTTRPTILIGHGGTQHKRVENVLRLARTFVRHLGVSVVAIDAPGHGDRVTPEPRVTAAVLGLAGASPDRPGAERFLAAAQALTIPLLSLFQANDELMTFESGIDLWKAFGSKEKTLHVNPGGHVQMPPFEREAAEHFFRRHLLSD